MRNTQNKPVKPRRGYWFSVTMIDNNTYPTKGHTRMSDLICYLSRFKDNPRFQYATLYTGDKERCRVTKQELQQKGGIWYMPKMNEYNSTAAKEYERPFASADDKQALVSFKLPFIVRGYRIVESQFEDNKGNKQNSMLYDIDIDTTSTNYEFVSKIKDISVQLTLSLPSSPHRTAQAKDVLDAEYIPNQIPLMLIKQGKSYEFADIEE